MVIEREEKLSLVWKLAILVGLVWTTAIAGVFGWNIRNSLYHTEALTTYLARAFFQQIVTARFWNATHGGTYVPITEKQLQKIKNGVKATAMFATYFPRRLSAALP